MNKIRFIIIAVFLVTLFLMADWPGEIIPEKWVSEERVDTMHSTSIIGRCFNHGLAPATGANATKIYSIPILNSTGDGFGFDLDLIGDSVFIDSLTVRYDMHLGNVADSILLGIADSIDNVYNRIYTNYDTVTGVTDAGVYANTYTFIVNRGYAPSLLSPFYFIYYLNRTAGDFKFAELYPYYTAYHKRYGIPQ